MAEKQRLTGVWTPVVTPFSSDLSIDVEKLITQCQWLLSQDCGLAIFGTNSEGNSLSVEEKIDVVDALIAAGIPPARLMPGTGACALPDAIRLSAHMTSKGCGGVLVLPPFYYKAVDDDGLYHWFEKLIEGVGDKALNVYLYHIPPVAQVGFGLDLIERLVKAYPDIIVGIKDSAGDFSHTRELLARFPGWGVFPGNETHLAEAMKSGAVGCISATCNVNPAMIAQLYAKWDTPEAEELQTRCNQIRSAFGQYPMIPAMKAAIAEARQDPEWRLVRPPLSPLTQAQTTNLMQDLDKIGFALRLD